MPSLLADAPDGVRADEVAQTLGTSRSSAYNLLDTLCREGSVVQAPNRAGHLTRDTANLMPADRTRQLAASDVAERASAVLGAPAVAASSQAPSVLEPVRRTGLTSRRLAAHTPVYLGEEVSQ